MSPLARPYSFFAPTTNLTKAKAASRLFELVTAGTGTSLLFFFWPPLFAVMLLPLHPRRFCGVCWGGGLVLMHHHRSTYLVMRVVGFGVCLGCRMDDPRLIWIMDGSRHRPPSRESSLFILRGRSALLCGKVSRMLIVGFTFTMPCVHDDIES